MEDIASPGTVAQVTTQLEQMSLNEQVEVGDWTSCLPKDLVLLIFSLLNVRSLSRCLAVNRSWRQFASEPVLWNQRLRLVVNWQVSDAIRQRDVRTSPTFSADQWDQLERLKQVQFAGIRQLVECVSQIQSNIPRAAGIAQRFTLKLIWALAVLPERDEILKELGLSLPSIGQKLGAPAAVGLRVSLLHAEALDPEQHPAEQKIACCRAAAMGIVIKSPQAAQPVFNGSAEVSAAYHEIERGQWPSARERAKVIYAKLESARQVPQWAAEVERYYHHGMMLILWRGMKAVKAEQFDLSLFSFQHDQYHNRTAPAAQAADWDLMVILLSLCRYGCSTDTHLWTYGPWLSLEHLELAWWLFGLTENQLDATNVKARLEREHKVTPKLLMPPILIEMYRLLLRRNRILYDSSRNQPEGCSWQ